MHVLVATDGHLDATATANFAARLAGPDGRVTVLTVDEVIAEVDAVTAVDIQRLALHCFCGRRLSMAVVGPLKDETFLRALLDEAQENLSA